MQKVMKSPALVTCPFSGTFKSRNYSNCRLKAKSFHSIFRDTLPFRFKSTPIYCRSDIFQSSTSNSQPNDSGGIPDTAQMSITGREQPLQRERNELEFR